MHQQVSGQDSHQRVRITFLSVAKCKGYLGDNAVSLNQLDPHLLPLSTGIFEEVDPQLLYILPKSIPYSLFSQPPEKVPLSSFAAFPIF